MRKSVATVLFLLITSLAFAQVVHDPNDPLYDDLDRWSTRGYLHALPMLRPYPVQLIEELLLDVLDIGSETDRAKAQGYLESLQRGSRPYHVGVQGQLSGEGGDVTALGAPTVDGVLRIEDWISASYYLGVYGSLREPGDELVVPNTYNPYGDFVMDWASIGPFNILQNWTSNLALGTANLYFQAGLMRSSFGPFFDNGIVIGPQAGRAGHFSVTYRRKSWSFAAALIELSATDDYGKGQFPDKHLILHTIDFTPVPSLELGFYESVVWGGRFDPLYLAPLNQYFAAQSMAGFEDNSLFGFHARWAALDNLLVLGQVYIDDLNFNALASFNFDTKYKLAGELGLRWSPPEGALADLAADYTAVMPYMYTHITGDRETNYYIEEVPNFFNYTHRGRNLGTDLEPNSDRLSLRSAWRLGSDLELSLLAYFTRHGNASSGVEGITELNKGDIYDPGFTTEDLNDPSSTFHYETRFMTQSTIETKLACGTGLAWSFPLEFGILSAHANYVFEYGWNRKLDKGDDGAFHFWTLGASWRW